MVEGEGESFFAGFSASLDLLEAGTWLPAFVSLPGLAMITAPSTAASKAFLNSLAISGVLNLMANIISSSSPSEKSGAAQRHDFGSFSLKLDMICGVM